MTDDKPVWRGTSAQRGSTLGAGLPIALTILGAILFACQAPKPGKEDRMWRDIKDAPRGSTRTVDVGKGGQREVFVPDRVLTLTSTGDVIFTYWIPAAGRWNMFAEDHPPEVWWDFGDGANLPPMPSKEAQG